MKQADCIFLIIFLLSCCLTRTVTAQERIVPGALEQIKIKGWLGDKIDLCIHNGIAERSVENLVAPFRTRTETRCWQTEFWGKWMLSAVDAWRYTRDDKLKAKLDSAVAGLLATQSADGFIGNYAPEAHLQQWDIWGRKYCLLGLLAYYDLFPSPDLLKAIERLADHLLSEVGPDKTDIVSTGNFRGMPSSSVLEPIVLLYNRCKEKRYLDFAEYIVQQWETEKGPQLVGKALARIPAAERFPHPSSWWSWENGMKAYEMMSCYDGLLELYQTTGKAEYLTAVQNSVNSILQSELILTGSGSSFECWYHGQQRQTEPTMHMQETCVTQTIMKLLFKLYHVTRDPRLIDQIEISGYNALLGAMRPDGSSFAKYSPLIGIRQEGEEQCGMAMNCCTANGPRGMMLLPQVAITTNPSGPLINLYGEMAASLTTPREQKLVVEQHSDYPVTGTATIILSLHKAEKFTLQLRVPAWSRNTAVKLNGVSVPDAAAGKYCVIERVWKNRDSLSIELDMQPRWFYQPIDHHRHAAVMRGPLVLARDQRLDPVDVDEPASPYAEKNSEPALVLQARRNNFWLTCSALFRIGDCDEMGQGKPREIVLCDYASAGNTWNRDSRFRVWWPKVLNPMEK